MTYRVGSAEGFYGDNVLSALPMIRGGHVDVVCFEALAELTLAILQKDRMKDPSRGYTFDIELIARKVLPEAFARKIPLITNGGGLNPQGAGEKVRQIAEQLGLQGCKIAVISGDNLLNQLDDLQTAGETLANMDTGQPLAAAENQFWVTGNVYLGAAPIVEALQNGADMVITGRVADPCLYLAPLVAHYGWGWDEWDKLASGIVAGHLLECTGQVVGGNSLASIDRLSGEGMHNLGYPIAEVEADGSFVLTKTPDMNGHVTLETVKEQLLYEVHDPANYITPDVVANFTTLRLESAGQDRVHVSGVTGKPRPEKLKLNLNRLEGYSRELIYTIGWPEAWHKFEQMKGMMEAAWEGLPIQRVAYSFLGVNSLYGSVADLPDDPLELIVRVVFTAPDADTLKTAVRRLMNDGLSGPAGMSISGTTIGQDPRPIVGLWPTLIGREQVTPHIAYYDV
ncbi:MAG: DUF1446 domain-containing protein [Anaerolineaceae bacterium]|nr:DUF1446 domain-containing protein [Anaerolineaceae bacterium]